MAKEKPSSKKKRSTAKKKSSSKKKSLPQEEETPDVSLTVVALDEIVGEFQTPPTNGEECILWRDGDVHGRIRAALSVWSNQPLNNITGNITLGQLSVGTGVPWNEGNQGRLVQATNEQNVFFPFPSRMNPPPILVPSTTTVADWERVVWRMQDPHTFCFAFGN
ncbi:MAG TPA: hypothetical protein VF088_14380 [Pyrinomonadaceae bacterium]